MTKDSSCYPSPCAHLSFVKSVRKNDIIDLAQAGSGGWLYTGITSVSSTPQNGNLPSLVSNLHDRIEDFPSQSRADTKQNPVLYCSEQKRNNSALLEIPDARDWVVILSNYRAPSQWQSLWEILVTAVPFLSLWALAWWSVNVSYALAVFFAILNAAFLVRLFMIQHDCGHGSYFRSRGLNDWVGRIIGVATLTPYDVWRRMHSVHHASTGNLEKRGMGDVLTLTVSEFRALSSFGRLRYRLYRHPLVLFGIGPFYLFFIQNRLPFGLMREGRRYWISAMGTNVAIALLLGAIGLLGGTATLFVVFFPTMLVAASIGVWLFYVQHQFEQTSWDHDADWQLHDAALNGSSHYVLPGILRWFTANIGVHHVHHLHSRIPFYRLPEVLRDHPQLAEAQRLTIRDSLSCVGKQLWDEKSRRLISFAEAWVA